jgi:hypothetical protein
MQFTKLTPKDIEQILENTGYKGYRNTIVSARKMRAQKDPGATAYIGAWQKSTAKTNSHSVCSRVRLPKRKTYRRFLVEQLQQIPKQFHPAVGMPPASAEHYTSVKNK